MKLTKSIAVFLTLSMLISLNACMAKTSEQNTSTAEQTSEEDILQAFKNPEISAQTLKMVSKTIGLDPLSPSMYNSDK